MIGQLSSWLLALAAAGLICGALYHRISNVHAYRSARRRVLEAGLGPDDYEVVRSIVAQEMRRAMIREVPVLLLGLVALLLLVVGPQMLVLPVPLAVLGLLTGVGVAIQADMLIGIFLPSLDQRWESR